jgi:hypothetical protein
MDKATKEALIKAGSVELKGEEAAVIKQVLAAAERSIEYQKMKAETEKRVKELNRKVL